MALLRLEYNPRMETEATIQTSIVSILRMFGYIVIEIGRTRRMVPCQRCGAKTPAIGWQGNTPGAPDLMVTTGRWGNLWTGLEVKRHGGAIRPEQRALLDNGSIAIVRSVRDALGQIIEIEERFGVDASRLREVRDQLAEDASTAG